MTELELELVDGWVERELAEEFPELSLLHTRLDVRPKSSPPAVRQRLRAFLAPVPQNGGNDGFAVQVLPLLAVPDPANPQGWPLRTAVASRVLLAEAARVAGVTSVADVLLAEGVRAAARPWSGPGRRCAGRR